MVVNNKCQCGSKASQLVVIKGCSIILCNKHLEKLEQSLGEKIEPLTTNATLVPLD